MAAAKQTKVFCFFFVTAQVGRSRPGKASGKASGSVFEKKNQKTFTNSG
jgi:hypothetical protein